MNKGRNKDVNKGIKKDININMKITNQDILNFNKAVPEDWGIPSEAIMDFIRELDADGFCMHGFMMIKDGQVISEGYYDPFNYDTPHRMYSVGKSFTSVAVGLLQQEGKLSLNHKICDYFPDKLPVEGVHPYIEKTTIRDMLLMATPHNYTTYKQVDEEDWVKTFFTVTPSRYPGTSFVYDTSSTHVLSALVERLSGKSLLEYLWEKVLGPLDCSDKIRWLTCPMGICQGGSGLICTLRDLAKFAFTCMRGGRYGGMQLIPENYIREATSCQISTCLQPVTEEQQGYGYQFWRCRNNGFSLFGMGGQLAICLPDKDFILVTEADNMANPNGVQGIYNALWNCINPHLNNDKTRFLNIGKAEEELTRMIANLRIKTEKGKMTSKLAEKVNGTPYYFESNTMGITQCSLIFEKDKNRLRFEYFNNNGLNSIDYGFGHMEKQKFPGTDYYCISSAAWIGENVLHLRSYVIDECYASLNITITFLEDTITLAMKKTSESFLQKYEGCISGETAANIYGK